jgi:hypothetical protein
VSIETIMHGADGDGQRIRSRERVEGAGLGGGGECVSKVTRTINWHANRGWTESVVVMAVTRLMASKSPNDVLSKQ